MRFKLVSVAAALLAAMPGISLALGLGDIQLRSTLNAPLNAEIELIDADSELGSLKVQLASRDAFSRYGLDYPAWFSGIQARVVRLQDGRNVVQLTSTAVITEPFATLLVEANWARGRTQREYTVLFDPPTFAPQQAPAAPIAAPTGGDRSAEIARQPAQQPATPAPAPAPAATQAPSPVSGDYTVPRGDSLSAIAQRRYGAEQRDQAMIAIYRSNPQAFGSNINELRAGSVLRLPEGPAVTAVDRAEARGEVRRQLAEWTNRVAPAPAADPSPRLVLVPPGGAAGTGTGTASSTTPSPATPPGTGASTESNRVQLSAPDIARVQQQAEPPKPAPAAAVPPPAATTPAPAPAAAPAGSGDEVSVEELTAPVDVEAEPAAEPKPPVKAPTPAAKPTPAASPSLVDRLADFWYVPAGIVALLLLLLGVRAAKRRSAAADTFAPFAIEPTLDDRDTSADTFPLRKPPEGREQSFVVEENSSVERTLPKAREALRNTVDLDEPGGATASVDASGSFDQGDPLAEADFHMAYGLYDQAADLVKLAIAREPHRRDLKLKLLEVFFVWGNKEQFLQTARELAGTRDAAQPGEWEKVVIMGKQLAPEDTLFSQAYGAVSPASVDLNLEGGQNLVDFDLPSESSTRLPALGDGGTNEFSGLDFVLDDPSRGSDAATTQAVAISTANMKSPAFAIDCPTVEQPALGIGDTLSNKLGAHRSQVISSDQTAELAIDDLGLDLGKLEGTGTNLLDDSQLTRALDMADGGAPTLVAGLDDTSRQLLQNSATQVTELLPMSDDFNINDTSRVSVLDLNLENDATATTGTRGTPDFGLDLDVGSVEPTSVDGEYQRTQRIHPSQLNDVEATQRDLEPVSMSEVGTKLDLARAYMDMGDPDGARSILSEVQAEGSPTQRQEAQRLLDSIPG